MILGKQNRPSKFSILLILAVVTVFLAEHVFAFGALTKPGNSTMNQANLWQVIDSISRQHPFAKEKIESILSVRLEKEKVESNDRWDFFVGRNVSLADGIIISTVNFYFKKSDPSFAEIGLNDIKGGCITVEQVRDRYNSVKILGSPRGESPQEQWHYSIKTTWGNLIFGFSDGKTGPECLASVGFDAGKR